MKKAYNVLIIGAGKIGSIRAKTIRKFSSQSGIFIFDKDLKKSTLLSKEVNGHLVKSLKKCLESKNIDIVVVSVFNKYLMPICLSALRNKKHVLCEKPMGISYKESLKIANAATKYNRKFKCGFNHRYHPSIQEAYNLYKKNVLGEILYIRGIYGHGGRIGYEKEWRAQKPLSGGGELLDQGCHLIDLCYWFFDFEKIKNIYGIAKPLYWKMKVDDNSFLTIETESGKVAHLHASWTQWKNQFKFEIYGTKGAIEINGLGKSYGTETLTLYKKHKTGKPPVETKKKFKSQDNSWEHEWIDLIKAINQNKLPMSNQYESCEVMKTISYLYSL